MFSLRRNYNKLITTAKLSTCSYTIFTRSILRPRIIPNIIPDVSISQENNRLYCSSSSTQNLTDEEINQLTHGDEAQAHMLKVLILETEVMRQEGKAVPSSMSLQNWKDLLGRGSRSGRKKFLDFLFKIEKKKENQQAKKELKKLEAKEKEPIVEGAMRYHLGHNNIFLRIYDTAINNLYNSKLVTAMKFSQKLVIDCGYHEHMSKRENINCAKQLTLVFAENRIHDDPFDIHYCNLKKNEVLEDYTRRFIPTMYDAAFPFNAHERSYLDLFPRDKLVYLTPHCKEELSAYDHDAVYIIGGIVDKMSNDPLSLAKAKREGLKMAKLPLDKYLLWGSGSGKSLTLNQVLLIMLDMRMKGDWNHALRHVPRRKLAQCGDASPTDGAKGRKAWISGGRWSGIDKMAERPLVEQRSVEERYAPKKSSSWRPRHHGDRDEAKERMVHLKKILQE